MKDEGQKRIRKRGRWHSVENDYGVTLPSTSPFYVAQLDILRNDF